MEKVQSADGITIAYEKSGTGPAVVLVTGAFCDRGSSATLAAKLRGYTVYRYDRRGRGDSGDAAAYATEREIDDLAAVVAATGAVPYVYGHSSGAILALEAAAGGVPIAKVAAYEPPYTGESPAEVAEQLAQWSAAGERDRAAEGFMRLTGMPQQVIDGVKQSPGWAAMTAIAHTLAYDLRICGDGRPSARLASVSVPTLAMAGGTSAPWAVPAAESVAAVVQGAVVRVVEGQNHNLADAAIAPVLTEFFS
ncbi:alpha/beta hydrolase [Fodinicola feengrottensis]|uniref:Alpha/beta hydrolase n=1 Tax=Fodinicola feengrottensis TaxID=435914 RepID=A0ABN2HPN9_9ACTN